MNASGLRRRPMASMSPAAVIAVEDPVDAAAVRGLAGRVQRAMAGDARVVVIDLPGDARIDNHTLARLVDAVRGGPRGHRARLAVVSADPRVRWVLELCQIDGVRIHPTLKTALTADPDAGADRPARSRWRGPLSRWRSTLSRSPIRPRP